MIFAKLRFPLALALLTATPALACDCQTLIPGSPTFTREVAEIADYYAVAADGVLERNGPHAWRLRVTQELKGSRAPIYRIVLSSDCSLDPQTMDAMVGKKVFLLLTPASVDGAAGAYEAGRCVNQLPPAVERAFRDYFRAKRDQ